MRLPLAALLLVVVVLLALVAAVGAWGTGPSTAPAPPPAAPSLEEAAATSERARGPRGRRERVGAAGQPEPAAGATAPRTDDDSHSVDVAGAAEANDGGDSDGLPVEAVERARALAEAAIEAQRDDTHRTKMRLIWPDEPPPPPSDGAEMLVIRGYLDYRVARVTWTSGVASGLRLDAARSWFYNDEGESYGAAAFTVDPDEFVATWTAVQMVRRTTAERREPLPEGAQLGGRFGSSGSHSPYLWVRVRDTASGEHAASERGSSRGADGVRDWDEIRDRAAHELVLALTAGAAAEGPISMWKSFVDASLREKAESFDADWSSPDRILTDVTLRAAGEVGDAATLRTIRALLPRLDLAERHADDARRSALRIRLRIDWDAEAATRAIVDAERGKYAGQDLVTWVRRRFRDRDPAGYLALLIDHLTDADVPRHLAQEAIAEIEAHHPGRARDALGGLLTDRPPAVVLDAAMALTKLGEDDLALPALEALATDATVRAPTWSHSGETPRTTAIEHLLSIGRWDVAHMARQVRAEGEDGHVVKLLFGKLEAAGARVPIAERRAIWRRVIEGPLDGGFLYAAWRLTLLDDRPSYERIGERIDAMLAAAEGAERDPIGRWQRERTIPDLRRSLSR